MTFNLVITDDRAFINISPLIDPSIISNDL